MSISKSSVGFTTISGAQLGSGPNQIGLLIGEDSYDGDVQFTISVNGMQIGGVQTTTGIQANGTNEVFTLNGTWATGSTVSVNFLNDSWDGQSGNGHDRNLYVDGLTYNGNLVSNAINAINWNGPSFYSTQPMVRAFDFVQSLGVGTHLLYSDTSYVNETAVLTELRYLGFDHVRDGGASADPASLAPFIAAMAAGMKFDFTSSFSAELPTAASNMETLLALHPGSIVSTEGINEVPAWFKYGGLTGQDAANLYQQQLYLKVHSDPKLAGVAVLNYTLPIVYNETDFTRYGNVSSNADYGNVHMYDYTGLGGISNYISTLLPRMLTGTPTSKGFVVTEAGYETLTHGDEISAKYLLDAVFDLKQAGASTTYLYELMDENPDPESNNTENHYGLFNYDATPKLAATAFHNLTTILADPGANAATFTPEALAYDLTGLPDHGNSMILAKSSGSFDIVVWAEPQLHAQVGTPDVVAVPVSSVTVTLGKVAASVQVFDPLLGSTPVAVYTNVSSVVVGVTDHPVILQLLPTPPEGLVSASDETVVSEAISTDQSGPIISSSDQNSQISHAGLVLSLSEDAYHGDAQFVITVDGQQNGGVYTATASHGAGGTQQFAVGHLDGGLHQVGISFLNDLYDGTAQTDRNLYLDAATYDGHSIANSGGALYTNSSVSFATSGDQTAVSTTVGSSVSNAGLVLSLSEDAYHGDAQFVITVDGQQNGGVYTATAYHGAGGTQQFAVGHLDGGLHQVGISFLNDLYDGTAQTDRNLYLDAATYDGHSIANSSGALYTNSSVSFATSGDQTAVSTTVGSSVSNAGLVLSLSEDAYHGDAQFVITVDGQQNGGVYTATASHGAGGTQQFAVGHLDGGLHQVGISFLNDLYDGTAQTDRNLYLDAATYDGHSIANSSGALYTNSSVSFATSGDQTAVSTNFVHLPIPL